MRPWLGWDLPVCVWNDSTFLKMNNHLFMSSSEGSPAFGPPASASHDFNDLELQGQVEGSSTDHSDTPFDGYTYAAMGLQFLWCVTTTLL